MNDSLSQPGDRIAVLGLGNVLVGDDCLGPYAVRRLEARFRFPGDVLLEDLGTPGLDLTPWVTGREAVILIDTVKADGKPGDVRLYRREDLNLAPTPRLSPHDPGLVEALALADLAGTAPESFLLVGVIPESLGPAPGISPPVEAALDEVEEAVLRELARLGVTPSPRRPPLEPDLWWLQPPGGRVS